MQVVNWGNSLAVRLPAEVVEAAARERQLNGIATREIAHRGDSERIGRPRFVGSGFRPLRPHQRDFTLNPTRWV